MDKIKPIGKRLIEAFETDDKAKLAKILGFKTVQGVYKVLYGESELDFEKLVRFQHYTKRSIDWLLTGRGEPMLDSNARLNEDDEIAARELYDKWRASDEKNSGVTFGQFLGQLVESGLVQVEFEDAERLIDDHFKLQEYEVSHAFLLQRTVLAIVRSELESFPRQEYIRRLVREELAARDDRDDIGGEVGPIEPISSRGIMLAPNKVVDVDEEVGQKERPGRRDKKTG